jgi:hypothetical protein
MRSHTAAPPTDLRESLRRAADTADDALVSDWLRRLATDGESATPGERRPPAASALAAES